MMRRVSLVGLLTATLSGLASPVHGGGALSPAATAVHFTPRAKAVKTWGRGASSAVARRRKNRNRVRVAAMRRRRLAHK